MRRMISCLWYTLFAVAVCCRVSTTNAFVVVRQYHPSADNYSGSLTPQQHALLIAHQSNARIPRTGHSRTLETPTKLFSFHPLVDVATVGRQILSHSSQRFLLRWKTYTMIPIVAGFVGWLTNYVAVQMIFRPIQWTGIPIYRKEGEPLGLFGWQGIVPAKTMKMSEAMVNATITQLLSMDEMIQRVSPSKVAEILLPQADLILKPIVKDLSADLLPPWAQSAALASVDNTPVQYKERICYRFLENLTKGVQGNVDRVLSLRNCVVEQMMADRSLLGKLFQISGKKELQFLTDSGLLFGFLLGILQLIVALYWDNPWTMSVGGLVVGLATNWLALKWIFEPVKPTRVGPFVLQGLFLRRQAEVSADFSKFFATKVLLSQQLWKSILTDPTTSPRFAALFAKTLADVAKEESRGLVDLERDPKPLYAACRKATSTLSAYLYDLHGYIDGALDIERTLRTRMMAMTSEQFERVLHPIFEEDELTLILAGGGLGFAAGLIQQCVSTGSLVLMPQLSLGRKTKLAVAGVAVAITSISCAMTKPWDRIASFKQELLQRVRDPQYTFYAIDLDRDGFLDQDEIRLAALSILGHGSSDASIEEMFVELDMDRDGVVSLDDFKQWWASTAEDDGFRRKLARGLEQDRPEEKLNAVRRRWRTIRIRNGRDVRVVWENRRLLLQQIRTEDTTLAQEVNFLASCV